MSRNDESYDSTRLLHPHSESNAILAGVPGETRHRKRQPGDGGEVHRQEPNPEHRGRVSPDGSKLGHHRGRASGASA